MTPDLETRLAHLTAQLEGLTHKLGCQQAELDQLRTQSSSAPTLPAPLPTNRRHALRRLAGGLLVGLVVAGAGLGEAQARTVSNPPGTNNQIGAIVVPPGKPLPTGTPPSGNTPYYGLLATDGSNLRLNTLVGVNTALYGLTSSAGSVAVYGGTTGDSSYSVYGAGIGDFSYGVYGAVSGANSNGVVGQATGVNSYAGLFYGNVHLTGSLSKSGGSFKIDHPLDPANQYLYHSFVESPDMKNIYDGVVTLDEQGTATVELPAWFEALNSDFRYSLTPIGEYAPLYVAQKVKDGRFKIAGGKSGQEVSWQLTGIRQDKWAKAHRIPVEEIKPDHERGLYLHPELFNQPNEKGIHQVRQPKP